MITAYTMKIAQEAITSAQEQAKSEMPNGVFILVGMDVDSIYFNIVAQPTLITASQKKDLQQKTRFALIRGFDTQWSYKAEFKMML